MDSITGPNNYTFQIRHHFTCTSTNVVYAILCTKCNLIYIGETKRKLADWFTEHLRSIRLMPGLPVARHFSDNHSKDHIKVAGIVQCCGIDDIRKQKEQRIIHLLGTLHPAGLNISFTAFKK